MHFLQLGYHVGKHTTWYLVKQSLDVNAHYLWTKQSGLQPLLTEWTEVISDLSKKVLIESRIELCTLECLCHNLCCRL